MLPASIVQCFKGSVSVLQPLKGAKQLLSAAAAEASAAEAAAVEAAAAEAAAAEAVADLFYKQSIELLLVMSNALANVMHHPAGDELQQLCTLKCKRPACSGSSRCTC